MRKKIFFCGSIAMIAIVSIVFFRESASLSKKALSEALVMQNVEALSSVELKPYKYYTCYSRIHAKDGCMVLYCPECTYISGTDDMFSSSERCMHQPK